MSLIFQVNGATYERIGILGKGGSSKVYSVICPVKRVIYALKRVSLERADADTYHSYTNEIELLKRLRGHDRIIQLIDHQITFTQANRPKMLMMVSLTDSIWCVNDRSGDGMWRDRFRHVAR